VTDPARPHEVDHALPEAAPRPVSRSPDDERQELDHRLANSLQLAADFLIFEHMRVADPGARAALIETAERLSAVGQMHRFLASHRQSGGVDLEPFLTELGRLIAESTGLICHVDAEPVTTPGEIAQQLAIAVNELAMNAAKHAYPWGDRGPLYITCRRQGGTLVVSVSDDGEGLAKGFATQQKKGLGMTIVEAIVRQLGGMLDAANDLGARFTITLPLPAKAAPASRSFAPPPPPGSKAR
jgi:two-component sensor histidine kinase